MHNSEPNRHEYGMLNIRHRALGTKWSAPRLMQPREVEDCSFLRAQTPKFPGALGRFRGFPRGPPEGDFLTPLTRIVASDPPLEAPDKPQETPGAFRLSKMAQGASKTVPRRPKRPPRRSQDGPRGPQDGPRATQDGPRGPQDEPQRDPRAIPKTEKSNLPP